MMSGCVIIGIDCATIPSKRGVAVGLYDGATCSIELPKAVWTDDEISALVARHLKNSERLLLAIDAPLGWPTTLGKSLSGHVAGQPLHVTANSMFRRYTDQFIKKKTGKQPLDVGADRIARTAHSALNILAATSKQIGSSVPLAWNTDFCGVAAVEVYPAATLKVYGMPDASYKEKKQWRIRSKIVRGLLQQGISLGDVRSLLANADMLDAVVCVLAGVDFLLNRTYQPDNDNLASKEGWIWVRTQN